jgi:hypothetical protein
MTYACSRHPPLETAAPTKPGSPHHCKFSKVHTGPRFAHAKKYKVIQNNENKHGRGIGQGEARHRKYKKLKLGGGQACDRSSD